MSRDLIICGLDIGTNTIRTIVSQKRRGSNKLAIIGIGEAPSAGVRKGVITDIEEAINPIKESIKLAEQSSGYSIRSVYLNVSGPHITSRMSKGIVSVSRVDQEISKEDLTRVIDQVQSLAIPPNKEILHVLPREYIVDGEGNIKDPLGMRGLRLEVDALVIEGSTPVIKILSKCLEIAGIEIEGIMLSTIASSQAVLSKRQMELGVLSLDIGGGTSGLAIFEEGSMIHTAVLPIGSDHITNDIAIGLRIDVGMAEAIKMKYGACQSDLIPKKEMINISLDDYGEKIDNISRKEVAEIMEARLEEIFELAEKELKKVSRQALLPAGVVLTGGGAKIAGIADFAKDYLKLPAQVGVPDNVEGVVDQVLSPQYATGVGLCLLGLDALEKKSSRGFLPFSGSSNSGIRDWLRKYFRMFLP
jgi:cell division protein FtsA